MQPSPAMQAPPAWLQTFLDQLAADDLSAATRRGYRYDLLQFIAWHAGLNGAPPDLARLTEHDLITWRQHMMTRGGLKAASINRRLEAVRRLLRWAEANGAVARNVALLVKSVRVMRRVVVCLDLGRWPTFLVGRTALCRTARHADRSLSATAFRLL
jgi:site-specific recombinase XerD